jgi:gas vesicle protein
MNTSKILLGFAAGAAIGAALGILFAPDKGTETRRRISEKGNDVADSIKDRFSGLVEGVKDKFSHLKSDGEDVAEKGYTAYNRSKSEISAF